MFVRVQQIVLNVLKKFQLRSRNGKRHLNTGGHPLTLTPLVFWPAASLNAIIQFYEPLEEKRESWSEIWKRIFYWLPIRIFSSIALRSWNLCSLPWRWQANKSEPKTLLDITQAPLVPICDLIIKFCGRMNGAISMKCPSWVDKTEIYKSPNSFPHQITIHGSGKFSRSPIFHNRSSYCRWDEKSCGSDAPHQIN